MNNHIRKFVRREHPAPLSFGQAMLRSLTLPLIVVMPAVLALSMLSLMGAGNAITPKKPGHDLHIVPAPDPMQQLLEKHKDTCWTGSQQPKAKLPGAAIIRFYDGRPAYTTNHKLVDAAFNEALFDIGFGGKKSAELDVIALCK